MKSCENSAGYGGEPKNDGTDFPGCSLPGDAHLLEQGWQKRFLADPRMARDAEDSYKELGYEVRLEPLDEAALKEECSGCLALLRQFRVVYTRKLDTP